MSLTPGTRLGPYEISVQIGVGGLGGLGLKTGLMLPPDLANASYRLVLELHAQCVGPAFDRVLGRGVDRLQRFRPAFVRLDRVEPV